METIGEKEPSMPTLDEFNLKVFESKEDVGGGDVKELAKSVSTMKSVSKMSTPTTSAMAKKGEESKASTGIKVELSEKQKEEIKEAFTACDIHGNGYMSTGDLKIALRALGFEPRKNDIKKIIEKVDKSNIGKLCFADFMEVIILKLAEKDSRDEILKAFKLFDKDQTGFISFENLRQISVELGEGLNDEEIREMIEEADMDSDGSVNQDEFLRIMKKTSLY